MLVLFIFSPTSWQIVGAKIIRLHVGVPMLTGQHWAKKQMSP
jgi:hypothetical protein